MLEGQTRAIPGGQEETLKTRVSGEMKEFRTFCSVTESSFSRGGVGWEAENDVDTFQGSA